jgi:hypothetical protein
MSDPHGGDEAEQDQAENVIFVQTRHAALCHDECGLKTAWQRRDFSS